MWQIFIFKKAFLKSYNNSLGKKDQIFGLPEGNFPILRKLH
jgi:hypothetical protein